MKQGKNNHQIFVSINMNVMKLFKKKNDVDKYETRQNNHQIFTSINMNAMKLF